MNSLRSWWRWYVINGLTSHNSMQRITTTLIFLTIQLASFELLSRSLWVYPSCVVKISDINLTINFLTTFFLSLVDHLENALRLKLGHEGLHRRLLLVIRYFWSSNGIDRCIAVDCGRIETGERVHLLLHHFNQHFLFLLWSEEVCQLHVRARLLLTGWIRDHLVCWA